MTAEPRRGPQWDPLHHGFGDRRLREAPSPASDRNDAANEADDEGLSRRLWVRGEPNVTSRPWWRGSTPGAWFLLLVLPVGLWLLFTTPPFEGLDEGDHFSRTYTITQGELVTQQIDGKLGGFIPTCVADWGGFEFRPASYPGPFHFANFWHQPVSCDSRSTSFAAFPNSAFYSPVSYLPQALAVLAARLLGAPVPILFFAGRLAAFLAFLGLVFASLQIATRAHALIFIVGAWPMTLLVATTYSADTMVIALALLLVAAVLRARDDPEAWWPAVTAFVAALGLAMCKSTYFVLAALLLLIPAGMFARRSFSWATKVAALGVVGLATLVWYAQVRDLTLAQLFPPGEINPHAQLMVIVHKPLWYAHLMVNMLLSQGYGYPTWETFGGQIGFYRHYDQGEPFAPPWVLLLGVVLLALAYAREARALKWSWSGALQASLPIVLVVVNIVLIFTAIFVEASPVGSRIFGIQGRYFLPLVAVPVLSVAVLSSTRPGVRSVVPFMPFLAAMQAWLLYDAYLVFYR